VSGESYAEGVVGGGRDSERKRGRIEKTTTANVSEEQKL
jgi:hypothetical protein